MTDSNLSEVQIQNLLDAITDSVLAGDSDLDSLTKKHGIRSGELQSMTSVIEQLNRVIVPVQPSQQRCVELVQLRDLIAGAERTFHAGGSELTSTTVFN